ncbi:MAG: phenylalanine--tRNA ligase subunit beta [Planctomycetota bacterium]
MKISYNWLKDYCSVDMPAHELASRLSQSGLCVETYEPIGDDYMLDVEVTSNRPDCLSHIGIAREVAALTGTRISQPDVHSSHEAGPEFNNYVSVSVESPRLCPHYTARLIRGITVGPSPQWLRKRLEICGVRPVNNIVDVTNYVLLESGQPLHAFDLSCIAENQVIVRRAREGESITTIDGQKHALTGEMCVIADVRAPVALAGIMGGQESEIGEETTDVLLESARFSPPNIRRTSRRLGLSSESSYRFERGVDPENVNRASRRAAGLILETAGGELANGMADIRSDEWRTPQVSMRFDRMDDLLGLEVDLDTIESIFEGLELSILQITSDAVIVDVPSWRADLTREIDLIEEIARVHGYDKISEETHIPVRLSSLPDRERYERRVRQTLTGEGFDEVITYSLVSEEQASRPQPWSDADPVRLRNPVSSDKTHLRMSNLPNMLQAKRYNAAHDVPRVDIFELGKVYLPEDDGPDETTLPTEKCCLSLLTDREDGLFLLKGVLKNIADVLHLECDIEEEVEQASILDPERSLRLKVDGEMLGYVGITSDPVMEEFGLSAAPALMELDYDLLVDKAQTQPSIHPIPKYPAVDRDIAISVEEGVRWAELEACVDDHAPEHLESVQFFDVYRGKPIPAGKKSVAFSITLRSPNRTLTREEADAARDEIVEGLSDELGAELRT